MLFKLPENVSEIIRRLEAEGYEAYAVGGCVRDMLLSRTPKDWDVTTMAEPEEVKAIFKRTVDTGIKHGTVTVLLEDGAYEVTTFRIDGKYEDSRHPSDVTFTKNLKDDLLRRDFTINAMAYNEEKGFVDCFGGMEDLKAGIIRCVGEPRERFKEDALRILRAYRFAANLGFKIDGATKRAASMLADTLNNISAERIREELTKVLLSPDPKELLEMQQDGITGVVLPELAGFLSDEEKAGFVLNGIKQVTATDCLTEKDAPAYAWGVLCGAACVFCGMEDPVGFTKKLLRRLKFDNDTISTASGLAGVLDAKPETGDENVRRNMNRMGAHLFGLWLVFLDGPGIKPGANDPAVTAELLKTVSAIRERNDCVSLKQLAVTGADLMEAGSLRGVALGNCLNYLLDRVLSDPTLNTKEKLLALSGEYLSNEEQS